MNWRPYLAGAFAGLLIACAAGTNAVSGPTQAQFDALAADVAALTAELAAYRATTDTALAARASTADVDTLAIRVEDLEARTDPSTLFAAAAPGGALVRSKAAEPEALGTLVAFQPAGPTHKATKLEIRSPMGYLYSLSADALVSGDHAGSHLIESASGSGAHDVYFASADCSGVPHVSNSHASRFGGRQGFVFMIGAGPFNATQDDPRQYLYVAKGTEPAYGFQYFSKHSNVDECEVASGTLFYGLPAEINDPGVTGVPSAHVPGPLALGGS